MTGSLYWVTRGLFLLPSLHGVSPGERADEGRAGTLFPLDIALLNEAGGLLRNVLVEEVGILSNHGCHAVIAHDRSSREVARCLFDFFCCPDRTDGVRMGVRARRTVDDPGSCCVQH